MGAMPFGQTPEEHRGHGPLLQIPLLLVGAPHGAMLLGQTLEEHRGSGPLLQNPLVPVGAPHGRDAFRPRA